MKGTGALALVTRDGGWSLRLLTSGPMMSPMPVPVWLETLAIVLAVFLVARAHPHVRRKQHVLVLEHRAVPASGALAANV